LFVTSPLTAKVVALANNKNAEHAILLFINGSNVWSVGYGFSGSGSRKDEIHAQNLRRKLNKAKKIPDGTKEAVAHAFETLQGALYTSDFLLANWDQEAHIIWVGSLNNEIKQRVLNYLSHVNSVELKSKGNYNRTGKLYMTNNTTLQVGGSFYTENASWISKDLKGRPKLNCLEWVKHILDVPLKCGLLGRPSSCNRITSEQWSRLMDADFLGDLDGGRNIDVLKNIQTSLLKTDPASLIGDIARMATNNPRATAACVGASCAAGAAFGPGAYPIATSIGNTLGTSACLGAGAACGLGAHEAARRGFNRTMESKSSNTQTNPPSIQRMVRSSRGGRKTRRKNKRRKTRNKRRRRRHKTRNQRKLRKKRKTRRR